MKWNITKRDSKCSIDKIIDLKSMDFLILLNGCMADVGHVLTIIGNLKLLITNFVLRFIWNLTSSDIVWHLNLKKCNSDIVWHRLDWLILKYQNLTSCGHRIHFPVVILIQKIWCPAVVYLVILRLRVFPVW